LLTRGPALTGRAKDRNCTETLPFKLDILSFRIGCIPSRWSPKMVQGPAVNAAPLRAAAAAAGAAD